MLHSGDKHVMNNTVAKVILRIWLFGYDKKRTYTFPPKAYVKNHVASENIRAILGFMSIYFFKSVSKPLNN